MKRELIHPDKQVTTGAYSSGLEIDGWVYVSGHGPLDLTTGTVVHGTIEEETRLTFSHLQKVLEAAGCSFHDVIKCTVHLADIHDFDAYNRTYQAVFSGVHPLPARTTVQSVLWGGIKIEIDVIARKGGNES